MIPVVKQDLLDKINFFLKLAFRIVHIVRGLCTTVATRFVSHFCGLTDYQRMY